jgi:acetoin utilization deacetylase AcuC-like enzyme
MRAYYCDAFVLPLPPGHRFPMSKYARLRARVAAELPAVHLRVPPAAADEQLERVHDAGYVRAMARGEVTAGQMRAIGFPWSEAMVERSRRSVGATIAACADALREGVAVNLAGGTHHAHRDRGQGYCVFNDTVVAAREIQRVAAARGQRAQVAVVDLDVHQGDGTAALCAEDPSIFTLSVHGEANFPFRKAASDIDVALPDGTTDSVYLAALDRALAQMRERFAPDLLIYVAGADAHEGDRLGRLKLTAAGMRERDRRVFALAQTLGAPVAVSMAGGYGHHIDATVEVHLGTVQEALAHWHRCGAGALAPPPSGFGATVG